MAQLFQAFVCWIQAHVQEKVQSTVAEGVAVFPQEVVGTSLEKAGEMFLHGLTRQTGEAHVSHLRWVRKALVAGQATPDYDPISAEGVL
eukprot:Skav207280  [mRNA]  locus=scaffold434:151016:152215:+ [translate_table: standard]